MTRRVLFKQCPLCGERKPMEAFWRNRAKADGRAYLCKDCGNLARRRRRVYHVPTGEIHAKCGGVLAEYQSDTSDEYMARCEKCRMVGVPA